MDMSDVFGFTVSISRYLLAGLAVLVLGSCVVSLLTRQFGSRVGSYLVESGTKKKRPLTHWENAIGRSNTCDVVLNASTVSRFHAVISKRRNGWVVADTNSRTGVFVNGKKVEKSSPLAHGDTVSFGTAAFEFVDADVDDIEREEKRKRRAFSARAAKNAAAMKPEAGFYPALIDEAAEKAYVIGVNSCVFGSDPGCDVRLRYSAVSARHARIYCEGSAWFIEDLQSQTGTKVNARALSSGRRRLKNGDIVGLGGVIFVFNENYKVRNL